ncbi:uncharacterized protein [Drosophila pseudoobscura]|uniref:Uncharacterized protein isoform X1 n=2 Tax=Drosophila pseudoobscura pseudoobscura TaxID=46245 RepID=A0A6I8WC37_DROPS|nr:uncharacterized protein LOC26534140 isoform X1 [Drosophila pseudoobscura]
MPPLRHEQLINKKIVHCRISFGLSYIFNNRSEPAVVRSSTSSSSTSTSTSTSSKKARTKDRLKKGNEGHIHSSEKPDVASSLRLSSSAFFASSAALVHPF